MAQENKTFIMVTENYLKKVYPAHDYQEEALTDYIDNHRTKSQLYIIEPTIIFSIDIFDSSPLQGDYSDFYSFIRNDGSIYVISRNENKLKNYCAFINRLISM